MRSESLLVPEILFEDTHLMVVCKPAGLLSQGEITGDDNLVDWARRHVGRNYIGLIHRLDRNTSGAMVLAKRTKSAERLTRALQAGELHRTYLAWLKGELREPARWQHRLLKDERTNLVRVLSPGHPQYAKAKEASLRVRPIRPGIWNRLQLTLAEFELETGRSHQIRAQSSHEGLPLLGDRKYAGRAGKPDDFPRPALHSHRINFPHPMSGEPLSFEAPLPSDLKALESPIPGRSNP